MKNIKRLGLTLIMILMTSSLAIAQESEVVMTQEELTSFLEKIAETRRAQLRSERLADFKRKAYMRNGKTKKQEGVQDDNRVLYQLDRINDRIDNLFMLHAGGVRPGANSSTLLVPGSNQVAADTSKDLTIAELQRQLDALKADQGQSNLSPEEERIANAKTPEERRDALKDLLVKFKNYKKQVFFANDSDKLTVEDQQYINDVTQVLNKYPELSIVLEGWASPRGKANYNKQLSMRRSESVERALTNKGISPSRIVSSFKGEDHSTSEAMARRVDMSVILK